MTLTPSLGAKNKFQRAMRVLQSRLWLLIYLIRNTHKDSVVLIYHSYEIAFPVLLARRIKRFKIILEIEEKYSMVWKLKRYQQFIESKLLKYGNKNSLVVSEVLADILRIKNPIISYGSYDIFRGEINRDKEKEKITLIYTGTIDKVRNSAYMSLEVMLYLLKKYELILSGSIAKGEEETFKEKIKEINNICGREACSYVGVLNEQDYQNLVLNADMALNLQQSGDFGQFLFPSKIITYLSYNLPVVSTKGDSIVYSEIANIITFANEFNALSISEAIKSINIYDNIDRRRYLLELDTKFETKFRNLLNNVDKHIH